MAGRRPGFSAVLLPHRSLGRKGFVTLMAVIGAVSFAIGLGFLLLGAWPVAGFLGLDMLLICLAFHINDRAARLYETVELDDDALTLTRVHPSGRSQSWRFNPYWVRLEVEEHPSRAVTLSLRGHGGRLTFGGFLSHDEKRDFAAALDSALHLWRGPHI